MCLILFAHGVAEYPLVLAANRDEFYERPTSPAGFWADAPHVLAGRDRRAGGTWMGVTRSGRWAAVTNYRDPPVTQVDRRSRGSLVADFLVGSAHPEEYAAAVAGRAEQYDGFNLLIGDLNDVYYFGNRMPGSAPRRLDGGVYGLSNHLLDTPWPKVTRGRERLAALLAGGTSAPDALLDILYDTEIAPRDALPDTGIGAEWEHVLSAAFVATPAYGTRTSTALIIDRSWNATFVERSFLPGPVPAGDVRFELPLSEAREADEPE
jgi:uncharacterized protein with NRDE domain